METKELKIVPPEGYEIDKENSTLECIKFKKLKQKCLTYEDIAKELFYHKESFYVTCTDIWRDSNTVLYKNCLAKSPMQFKKLFAINKLINVSIFLNQGWKPDWNNPNEFKYSFSLDSKGKIYTNIVSSLNNGLVFFENEKLMKEAIDILGEDTIRLALSTDY